MVFANHLVLVRDAANCAGTLVAQQFGEMRIRYLIASFAMPLSIILTLAVPKTANATILSDALKACQTALLSASDRAAELRLRINNNDFFDFEEFYRRYPSITRDELSQDLPKNQKYFTKKLGSDFEQRDIRDIFWSMLVRKSYGLTFRNGLICDWRGRPMSGFIHYVMDGRGNVYGGKASNHAEFLAGGDVASAGHLRLVSGKLDCIDRQSGHYKPTRENFVQVLLSLRENGISLSNVELAGFDVTQKEISDSAFLAGFCK